MSRRAFAGLGILAVACGSFAAGRDASQPDAGVDAGAADGSPGTGCDATFCSGFDEDPYVARMIAQTYMPPFTRSTCPVT